MTAYRTYYCDGPANPVAPHPDDADRCPLHGGQDFSGGVPLGWVKVNWMGETLHFCGWDCVLRHGARYPAVEVVEP